MTVWISTLPGSATLVTNPEHFYFADGKGALVDGEEDREWGTRLSSLTLHA